MEPGRGHSSQRIGTGPSRFSGRAIGRQKLMAVLVAVTALVLLVLASSSGPVRLWLTPSSTLDSATDGAATLDTAAPQAPVSPKTGEMPPWAGRSLQILGGLLTFVAVVAALLLVMSSRWPQLGWRLPRLRRSRQLAALAELPGSDIPMDLEPARALLAGGTPRNAIVACWMQLEGDAASAGLLRMPAETSAEYVERVVAASSVDPTPIGELAALYREARFSHHDLDDHHRVRAIVALDRVAHALRHDIGAPA